VWQHHPDKAQESQRLQAEARFKEVRPPAGWRALQEYAPALSTPQALGPASGGSNSSRCPASAALRSRRSRCGLHQARASIGLRRRRFPPKPAHPGHSTPRRTTPRHTTLRYAAPRHVAPLHTARTSSLQVKSAYESILRRHAGYNVPPPGSPPNPQMAEAYWHTNSVDGRVPWGRFGGYETEAKFYRWGTAGLGRAWLNGAAGAAAPAKCSRPALRVGRSLCRPAP
jgi:hypothetical protein